MSLSDIRFALRRASRWWWCFFSSFCSSRLSVSSRLGTLLVVRTDMIEGAGVGGGGAGGGGADRLRAIPSASAKGCGCSSSSRSCTLGSPRGSGTAKGCRYFGFAAARTEDDVGASLGVLPELASAKLTWWLDGVRCVPSESAERERADRSESLPCPSEAAAAAASSGSMPELFRDAV